jgi:hypothetical protein
VNVGQQWNAAARCGYPLSMTNDSSIERNTGGTAYDVGAAGFLRLVTGAVGATFLLVGVLGFVPGITTHYSDLSFAGHESDAKLIGIFEVSVLHNIVHLLFGVVGLAVANKPRAAVNYLIGGGVIYLVLWLYGLLVEHDSSANFVPVNSADNWLHFLLGLGMIGLGVIGLRRLKDRRHGPSLA